MIRAPVLLAVSVFVLTAYIPGVVFASDVFQAQGLNIIYRADPNAPYGISATRGAQPFRFIVLHHTGTQGSLDSVVRYGHRRDARRGGSFGYHFYVGKDGTIVQGAPLSRRTNHVKTGGAVRNENTIGIAAVGVGDVTGAQTQRMVALTRAVQQQFKIGNTQIFGHGEVQSNKGNEMVEFARFVRGSAYQGASIEQLVESGALKPEVDTSSRSFANRLHTPLARFLGIPQTPAPSTGVPDVPQLRSDGTPVYNTPPPAIIREPLEPRTSAFSGGGPLRYTSLQSPVPDTERLADIEEDDRRRTGDVQEITYATPAADQSQHVLSNRSPTLLCLPDPVEGGEEAMLMWACRDASNRAEGVNFDTQGETIGSIRVTPEVTTTYTLSCSEGTSSLCTIDVIRPALAIIATPSRVTRGGTVELAWQSKDTASCRVSILRGGVFSRIGTSGSAVSPTLFEDTDVVLTCETRTGRIKERVITVEVSG